MSTEQKEDTTGLQFLTDVRVAFPAFFKKADNDFGDGDGKFEGTFLIAKGSPLAAECIKKIVAVANAKWKEKGPEILKGLIANNRVCFRDGDAVTYDGFAGHHSLKASNDVKPRILGPNKEELTAEGGKPYSGCYVNASISFWAQDNKFGKRINANLRGVQFVRDGVAFSGGGTASVDEFGTVAGASEAMTGDPNEMFK